MQMQAAILHQTFLIVCCMQDCKGAFIGNPVCKLTDCKLTEVTALCNEV